MVDEIDPDDLASLSDGERRETRIVDIRDRRAFDRGHIPGSECIPFPELSTRITELSGASRVVTVCPHGIASQQAAQLIGSYADAQDARVESLRGGLEAWGRE
ncbi:rhodanese-like domain-containing protein, partial [Halorubrum sp. SD626R]|uniref:rhodanese-like domain-containing protein n=2 Tax=Halorubrum TaxID=56688 RepID=UPI0010F5BDAA